MEPFPTPWFYFIIAEYSCQSHRMILRYVCLDGMRRVLRSVRSAYRLLRFYWNVLRSAHACCLTLSAKQDGLRYLAFLFRRVEIAIRAFSRCRRGYLPLWVHFGFVRFFMAISTGLRPESAIRKGTPFLCGVPFAIDL